MHQVEVGPAKHEFILGNLVSFVQSLANLGVLDKSWESFYLRKERLVKNWDRTESPDRGFDRFFWNTKTSAHCTSDRGETVCVRVDSCFNIHASAGAVFNQDTFAGEDLIVQDLDCVLDKIVFEHNFFQSAEVVEILLTIFFGNLDFVKLFGSFQDTVVGLDKGVPILLDEKRGSKSHF